MGSSPHLLAKYQIVACCLLSSYNVDCRVDRKVPCFEQQQLRQSRQTWSSSSPTDSPPSSTPLTLAWTESPATSHHHQRRRQPRHHRQCSRKRCQLRANQQHSTLLRQGAKPKIIFHCCRNFLDWS